VFTVGGTGTTLHQQRRCTATEQSCTDGVDNDCDGYYDCGDTDCIGNAACSSGGLCAGATPIACGAVVSGTTIGGPSNLNRYACNSWLELGREKTYQIQRPSNGTVNVSLTGMTKDLDLIVLREGAAGACEPRNPGCVGASSTTGNESVTFTAVGGQTYYLVVDGYGANPGNFTLSVTCP
jgi:hypothetical protein